MDYSTIKKPSPSLLMVKDCEHIQKQDFSESRCTAISHPGQPKQETQTQQTGKKLQTQTYEERTERAGQGKITSQCIESVQLSYLCNLNTPLQCGTTKIGYSTRLSSEILCSANVKDLKDITDQQQRLAKIAIVVVKVTFPKSPKESFCVSICNASFCLIFNFGSCCSEIHPLQILNAIQRGKSVTLSKIDFGL